MTASANGTKSYRSIFISDIHLGARECQADALLRFLRENSSEYLYLVGDVFDGWALRRRWLWEQSYNDVIQKILRRARKGCRVIYIPGNHDDFARSYDGLRMGGIQVRRQAMHRTVDGRRLLVLHGDEFDTVVTAAPWLARLGSVAYSAAFVINRWFNRLRWVLGYSYWSLSAWLKHRVKQSVTCIGRFEQSAVGEAKRRFANGVVCGHIHRPAAEMHGGIAYYNTGDWVESCTALVEHFDGSLELIQWPWNPMPAAANVRREEIAVS